MKKRKTSSPSTSSPPGTSLREQIADGREPVHRYADGRALYRLPGGGRVVLSPYRQAKKLIMEKEGLSGRQFVKRRKQLNREARAHE